MNWISQVIDRIALVSEVDRWFEATILPDTPDSLMRVVEQQRVEGSSVVTGGHSVPPGSCQWLVLPDEIKGDPDFWDGRGYLWGSVTLAEWPIPPTARAIVTTGERAVTHSVWRNQVAVCVNRTILLFSRQYMRFVPWSEPRRERIWVAADVDDE